MTTITYLERFLEPVTDAFTPLMAETIIGLRADPELQSHIDHLRSKANQGTLTEDERSEYAEFVEAVDVISIIQSKARRFLARHSA